MSDLYDRLDWLINNVRAIQVEPKGGHIMSEHTAGAWQVTQTRDDVLIDAERREIAHITGSPSYGREELANARLIAAAPETTDMLEQAAAAFAVLANRAPTYEQKDFALEWFAKCKSQIARARGQEVKTS